MENVGRGIIQYTSEDLLIKSIGPFLYKYHSSNNEWEKLTSLPVSFLKKLQSKSNLLSRLLREEVNHVIHVNQNTLACFAYKKVFIIYLDTLSINEIGEIQGSRPLCVCSDGQYIYYGEYKSNKERSPISIHRYSVKEKVWEKWITFNEIRHIHGVFWDKLESKIWITTGDRDHESAIWQVEDNNPKKIISGSQQTRTVDLLFSDETIFFGTDAPDEPNFIYRYNRKTKIVEKLQQVGGPIFFGRKDAGGHLFFATVAEPSKINRIDVAELWHSNDKGNTWRLIGEFKKDLMNKRYFQYGQIKFPKGPGDSIHLWFSPYATKYSHRILKMKLAEEEYSNNQTL